jgi:hypothetical protein
MGEGGILPRLGGYMKDVAHHLKRIQKKVIQAARKEINSLSTSNTNSYLSSFEFDEKKKPVPKNAL